MDLAELEPHDHISALFDNAKKVDEYNTPQNLDHQLR